MKLKYVKVILFTHDDLDGGGCRVIFSLAHSHLDNSEWMIINCSNNSVNDDVKKAIEEGIIGEDTIVCFADICASKEVIQMLVQKCGSDKIFVWDHHLTNLFITQEIPNAVVIAENELGVKESGTSLLYKHFSELAYNDESDPRGKFFRNEGNQKLLSLFVDTVRSYDTYEWKQTNNIDAIKLNKFFWFIGMDLFCNRYIDALKKNDNTEDIILADGDLKYIINSKIELEKKIIDSITPADVFTFNVRGYKVAFSFPIFGASASELGNQFLTRYAPEYDIFVSMSITNDRGTFQFRTIRPDLNLGKDIAIPLGGGGHPKAAGAPVPEFIVTEIIDMVINHLNSDSYIE